MTKQPKGRSAQSVSQTDALNSMVCRRAPSANSIHASRLASGRYRQSRSRSIRYRRVHLECGPRDKNQRRPDILVDDEGHDDDLVALIREAADRFA